MSLFKKARETLAKAPEPAPPEPRPPSKAKPSSRPRYLSVGTENLEIRLRVSDYALVQSLVVDGRRRLAAQGYTYNERQMLWAMATALYAHLGRAVSDQELVGTSWLDSRMVRWAIEYGYLHTQENRAEANRAQELLSQVTGQDKKVRPELKVPVPLVGLTESVQAAGKEVDLTDFKEKMSALEAWVQSVVQPQLRAKAGLDTFE